MKKLIIYICCLLFLVGAVTATTFTRTVPPQVNPGSSFSVTYSTNNAGGNWGVLIEDDISGGCTPEDRNFGIMTDEPSYSETKTFTAPSSGSCTFHGNYLYTGSTGTQDEIDFPDVTITIGSAPCTPNWEFTSWTPTVCPSTCSQTRTVTDSNNCGTTVGKPLTTQDCTGGSCSVPCVPDCSGKECGTDGCASNCGTCPTGETCSAGQCIEEEEKEETCEEINNCDIWQQCNDEKDDCELAGWAIMVIAFMGIMFAFSMVKK